MLTVIPGGNDSKLNQAEVIYKVESETYFIMSPFKIYYGPDLLSSLI